MISMSGSLDLPIERQRQIAKDIFKMSHADWVAHMHELHAEFAAYEESIKDTPPSKLWSNPQFQKRVDSENNITRG